MTRSLPALILVFALALSLPATHAADAPALPSEDKCAPPCGVIYATIGVEPELSKDMLATSKLDQFPTEIPLHITYSWDMEQDGTGIPGDAEEIVITLAITKKPTWLDASILPVTCSFMLIPVQNEYDVCTVMLSTELNGQPLPYDETSFDELGKRLMIFATSSESGMFKKSYGVEDMRWRFDDAPASADPPIPRKTAEAAAPGAVPVVALSALLGAIAVAGRRRQA